MGRSVTFLANMNSRSGSLYAVARLSVVCLSSVTFVRPTQAVEIAILDLSESISRKRCKIGGKLVIITNMKSYISFRLVPKSVTFNDRELPNGP